MSYSSDDKYTTQEQYHRNGRLLLISNYKNDRLHGLQESWWDDGKLSYRKNYTDGKQDGIDEEWSRNGRLRHRHNYTDGYTDGIQEYNRNPWIDEEEVLIKTYYLEGKEVTKEAFEAYLVRFANEISIIMDIGEKALGTLITQYSMRVE